MERVVLRYRDLLTRKDIATIIAIGLGNALTLVLLVLLIREAMQELGEFTTDEVNLGATFVMLVAATLIQSILKVFEFAWPEMIGFRIVHELRQRLHAHMAGMAPRQIQHRSRGSLILRLSGDLTMLRTWISRGMGRGVIALFSIVACVGILSVISWRMALACSISFVIGTSASVLLGSRLQKLTGRVRRRRSLLTSNIDEQVNALAVVQVFGRSGGEANRLARQSAWMTKALVQEAELRGLLRGLSTATGWTALVLALGLGALDVIAGRVDLGAVLAAVIVVRQMQGHFRTLGLAHDYWRRAEISRRKLEDFLNSSSRLLTDPDKQIFAQNRASIVFDNVSVPGALEGISAIAPAGQHIAIVGHSGAGKSTLLQTVAQMVPLSDGCVRIGEQQLDRCQIASIVRKIGMVSPDLPLMRGTIRRNLTYRQSNTSAEELDHLIERCNLRALIDSFPEGLDYWVTEGGANLSVGARQCIAIGRAMLGNPPILLLDEAISPLDNEYRSHFRNLIARHAGTILSVTHDPAEIGTADHVWTLNEGRLISVETAGEYLARHQRVAGAAQHLSLVG
ncbi:MAG: ABC transporter ATP-binding protein [Sphingomonadaceae bacterium]